MTSGPQSGKHGVVQVGGVSTEAIRNWTFNDLLTPEDQVHSASLGGHNRLPGFNDWNGTMEGFGGFPPFFPGEFADLSLFHGPDTGVYGSAGLAWNGNAIIDSLSITWNFTPGGSLGWSAGFSANGARTISAAADMIDVPSDCLTRMCDLLVQYSVACTADAWVAFPKIQTATLNFTADNQPVTNSSTNCETFRRPGNIDWMLDLVDTENHQLLSKGLFYKFRLFTTAALFWQVAYGLHTGLSNINVNPETGVINAKSNDFAMSGNICCSAVITTGAVINPAPVTKWPVTAA